MKNNISQGGKRNSFAPKTNTKLNSDLRVVNHQPKKSMQIRFDGGNTKVQNYHDRLQTTRSRQG